MAVFWRIIQRMQRSKTTNSMPKVLTSSCEVSPFIKTVFKFFNLTYVSHHTLSYWTLRLFFFSRESVNSRRDHAKLKLILFMFYKFLFDKLHSLVFVLKRLARVVKRSLTKYGIDPTADYYETCCERLYYLCKSFLKVWKLFGFKNVVH